VADRLQYHAGNDKGKGGKPFWVDTIAMVSKDDNHSAKGQTWRPSSSLKQKS